MPAILYGSKFEVTASPKLILDIEELLEKWVTDLCEREGEIDLEREAIGMAQKIVVHLANQSE